MCAQVKWLFFSSVRSFLIKRSSFYLAGFLTRGNFLPQLNGFFFLQKGGKKYPHLTVAARYSIFFSKSLTYGTYVGKNPNLIIKFHKKRPTK